MILEYYLMYINNIYISDNTKARDLLYQHVYNHIKDNIDYFRIEYKYIDDFETEDELSFDLDLMLTNGFDLEDLNKLGLINGTIGIPNPMIFKVNDKFIKVSDNPKGYEYLCIYKFAKTFYGIRKGYTINVHSWEHDWDNHQTNHLTVDTREEAIVLYNMMQLCKNNSDQPENVTMLGNSFSFDDSQIKMICNYVKEHYYTLNLYYQKIYKEENSSLEHITDDDLLDMFNDLSGELLGKSNTYCCRVMEKCVVTYSEIDIFPEIIMFDTIQTNRN